MELTTSLQQFADQFSKLAAQFSIVVGEHEERLKRTEAINLRLQEKLEQIANRPLSAPVNLLKTETNLTTENYNTVSQLSPLGNAHPNDLNKVDVLIVYNTVTAERVARVLLPELKEQSISYSLLPIDEYGRMDAPSIEQLVADCTLVISVLSKDALKQPPLIFAMEASSLYRHTKVVLLHDSFSCNFPGYNEQPETVRGFFSEKAITYLEDYVDTVVSQIRTQLLEKQAAVVQVQTLTSHFNQEPENIKTRIFLSHRRLTAQAIAGRLYEGLKNDYKCFLDSETQFKIHDLETIVHNTNVFIFILSGGILDSQWCIKELRSAIQSKKDILVIRDNSYQLPELFPVSLMDIEDIIRNAKTLTWMAEYNTNCIEKIKGVSGVFKGFLLFKEYVGPSDEFIEEMQKFMKENKNFEEAIAQKNIVDLDLSNWKSTITNFVRRMNVNTITSLTLVNNACVSATDLKCLKKCENLKKLTLEGFYQVNDETLRELSLKQLESIVLDNCRQVTDVGVQYLAQGCPNLKKISLKRCVALTDAGIVPLATNCKNIEELYLSRISNLTNQSLQAIGENLPHLVAIDLYNCDHISAEGIKFLVNCSELKYVQLRSCEKITDEALEFLGKLNKLKYLNLKGVYNITDSGIKKLSLASIFNLNLEKCTHLTDDSLLYISTSASSLISLQLDGCKLISDTGLLHLSKGISSLQSLGINNLPLLTYDGLKAICLSNASMLYLHNVGCRLDESVIQSIKKWLPSLKYMASSKKAPFLKEDPKYADGQPPLDENSMTLWLRADDLRDNGYNPGWTDYSDSGIEFKFVEDPQKLVLYTPADFGYVADNHSYSVKFAGSSTLRSEYTENLIFENDFTIFFVKRNSVPTVPNFYFFEITPDVLHLYQGGKNFKFIVKASGNWTQDFIDTAGQINTDQLHLVTYMRHGTTMMLKQHNNPVVSRGGTPGPIKGNKPYSVILGNKGSFGQDKAINDNPSDFLELVVFKEYLDADRMVEMQNYFQAKYQFKVPLL